MAGDAPDSDTQPKQWPVPETLLAILVGCTAAMAPAPWVAKWYYTAIGWPHSYITHTGPIKFTSYGDLLCWGDLGLMLVFPLLALGLGLAHLRPKRTRLLWLCLCFGLALVQFLLDVLGLLPLASLLE